MFFVNVGINAEVMGLIIGWSDKKSNIYAVTRDQRVLVFPDPNPSLTRRKF